MTETTPTAEAVDDYLTATYVGADAALDAALAASDAAGLPQIAVSPPQGKLLEILARTVNARRILEVGTLGGYSGINLARALPSDGILVTCEIDDRHADVAEANFAAAGVGDLVQVVRGPATETLKQLVDANEDPFDLVFIDANKSDNPTYAALAMDLVRPGSLIIVDNVVRRGAIVEPGNDSPDVVGTRAVLEQLAAEPRLEATAIQTVGAKHWDGFAIAVVR